MNNVDYRVLKSTIIKACKQDRGMEFKVDFDKLADLAEDINLEPIYIREECKRVDRESIPFLSEYFEKTHLSWFTQNKFMKVIAFIDMDDIDEDARKLLDNMKVKQVDDPDLDKVNIYATLVANYRCYFATIISYQNNDPNRAGRPSYEIVCRANKVVIKSSDYQYNPKDFS